MSVSSKTSTAFLSCVSFGCAALAACAAQGTPEQVVEAREAYHRAAVGPASSLAVAELDDAKKALLRAERELEKEGASSDTRDLAYIAERRAAIAESHASIELLLREKDRAERELAITRDRIKERRSAESIPEGEHIAEPERIPSDTKTKLSVLGRVREERRLVLTISAQSLFSPGDANILRAAKERLSILVDAVRSMADRRLVIQGHTDSIGGEADNQILSMRRAQAIREYLIKNGILADRIEAVGFGETRPIADNATYEGRERNRRIEVLVEPPEPPEEAARDSIRRRHGNA